MTHVNEKSVKIRTTGNEKNRFTVMLVCLGAGTKLPPYIIFKRKTLTKLNFPKGIIVCGHEKGWMAKSSMKEWLKLVWGHHSNTSKCSLLILDSYRCHKLDYVKDMLKSDNSELAFIGRRYKITTVCYIQKENYAKKE